MDADRRAAAVLGPEIDSAIRWCEKNHHPPRFLSVADGPGSFTGLRIAVTTAKVLSYAWAIPMVTVDSLAAIAASVFHRHAAVDSLIVALNAYRGQVFHGAFERCELMVDIAAVDASGSSQRPWTAHPDAVNIVAGEDWERILHDRRPNQSVAGDALPLGELASERCERTCDAIGVGMLGLRSAICNDWVDPISLVPRYLKPSAAEEKLMQR